MIPVPTYARYDAVQTSRLVHRLVFLLRLFGGERILSFFEIDEFHLV